MQMAMIRSPASNLKFASVLTVLVLLVASRGFAGGDASPSVNSVATPAGACVSAVQQTYDSMNQTAAKANALASSLYSQAIASYFEPTYSSIFQIDKAISMSTCDEQVQSFNVVFELHNSTGSVVAHLVISESKGLSVLGSSIQPNDISHSNPIPSVNYAGYTASPSTKHTIYTYATYVEYNQSTAQYPSSGCENSASCYVSTWTGLTDAGDGSGNIAQDGTDASCSGSGCTASYDAWYETVGSGGTNGAQTCTTGNGGAVTISAGDTIYAYVLNDYYNGGSNSKYDFYIDDMSSSTSCFVGGFSFTGMTAPTWAEWITELPLNPSTAGDVSLAKFGTISFTNLALDNSSTGNNIAPYGAVQDGYSNAFEMESGTGTSGYPPTCQSVVQNVQTSSMTSSSDFTNHWLSSTNTRGACA